MWALAEVRLAFGCYHCDLFLFVFFDFLESRGARTCVVMHVWRRSEGNSGFKFSPLSGFRGSN